MPYSIELVGPEGASRAWAGRLAERLGLVVNGSSRGLETIARLSIEECEGGPMFTLRAGPPGNPDVVAASYGELAKRMTDLIAERVEVGGS